MSREEVPGAPIWLTTFHTKQTVVEPRARASHNSKYAGCWDLGRPPDGIPVRPALGSPDADGPAVSRPDGDADGTVDNPRPGSPLLDDDALAAPAASPSTNQTSRMAPSRERGRDPRSSTARGTACGRSRPMAARTDAQLWSATTTGPSRWTA